MTDSQRSDTGPAAVPDAFYVLNGRASGFDGLRHWAQQGLPNVQNDRNDADREEYVLALSRADPDSMASDASESMDLRCQQVLRLLPGRRLVCRAVLGEKPCVVKWFYGEGAGRYQQRELTGCGLLAQAKVATPEIIGTLAPLNPSAEQSGSEPVYGLIFEFVAGAQPLDDLQLAAEPKLFDALWGMLAQMNAAGIAHNDLHFGNLLRQDHRLWLIDGDAVSRLASVALGIPESVRCFVRLAAQAQASLSVTSLLTHWASYCGHRRFPANAFPQALLVRSYQRSRRSRVRHFQAKTRRNCSDFASRRTLLGEALLQRAFLHQWVTQEQTEAQIGREFLAWLDALPGLMESRDLETAATLKRGNTATVVTANFRGEPLIVKRYNNKSVGHRLRRCLRPDRGLNSWVYAHTLAFVGIASAPAVALLRTRFAGPTYLVMRLVPGVELDPQHFQSQAQLANFEPVSQHLVLLLNALAAEGLVHGDTKASNFLWDAESATLTLIDLDSMQMPVSRRALANGHARDRRRLLRNFATTPELQRRLESLFGNTT